MKKPQRMNFRKIVKLLLDNNLKARKADRRFYEALEERKRQIAAICGQPVIFSDKNTPMDRLETLPQYHGKIDTESIKIAEEIEADYKRRQGNLVLKLAKFIKPEFYERKKGRKYKANDNRMKKYLTISRRILLYIIKKRKTENMKKYQTRRLKQENIKLSFLVRNSAKEKVKNLK